MPVSVDSNILWAYLAGDRELRERVAAAEPMWLLLPVLGEARFTVLNSARRAENHARLEAFIATCQVPLMGPDTALRYAEVSMALRRKGRPIPENDVWIAAVCLEHGLPSQCGTRASARSMASRCSTGNGM